MKIDFKLEGNRMERLEVEGSNIELAAGVVYLARLIYSATWKTNPESAKALKWAIIHESDMEIGPGHISATLTQEDVDTTIEEYVPKIWLYPDGRFRFRVNLLEGMGTITGEYRTYSYQNTIYRIDFEVQDRSFSGFTGDDVRDFALQGSSEEGRFSFLCYSSIGATGPYGSTFVLETDGE